MPYAYVCLPVCTCVWSVHAQACENMLGSEVDLMSFSISFLLTFRDRVSSLNLELSGWLACRPESSKDLPISLSFPQLTLGL